MVLERVGLVLYSLALLNSSAAALHGQARTQPAGVVRASAAAARSPRPPADLPAALAPRWDARVCGAILGALVGGAAGGAVGYLWVKTRSHPNPEWDFVAVWYAAAIGALVGLVVGAVAAC